MKRSRWPYFLLGGGRGVPTNLCIQCGFVQGAFPPQDYFNCPHYPNGIPDEIIKDGGDCPYYISTFKTMCDECVH